MARHVMFRSSQMYRDQLDRVRRYLDRISGPQQNDVVAQDDFWSFFQHCWHLKDWVKNDQSVPEAMRDQVVSAAHDSTSVLKICQEMANGTKHFGQRPGAQHDHMDTEITPGRDSVVDCKIDVNGTIRSGLAIARECVAEWERIFEGAGLSIERRS